MAASAQDPTSYGVENGRFRFDVQAADLYVDDVPEPSVLLRRAPRRDFVVQTKLSLDVPAEGCCFNFAQGGLVLYGSDDSFVKLTHTSIYETRQTEWAKEVPTGLTRYGNTVVGPPGDETWLRIVKETRGEGSFFTAYTSQDGRRWVRGGTWSTTSWAGTCRSAWCRWERTARWTSRRGSTTSGSGR